MLALVLATATLLQVPFVDQEKDTCGAAALAMVLAYWGQAAPHNEIAGELLDRELRGIPGSRLRDFAARRGMTAIDYEGDLAQLKDYVAKGRPLIVALKVKGGRYHNVVVVGFDDERHVLLVNDPAVGAAREANEREFEKRWRGAGHWTLLVMPADPSRAQ